MKKNKKLIAVVLVVVIIGLLVWYFMRKKEEVGQGIDPLLRTGNGSGNGEFVSDNLIMQGTGIVGTKSDNPDVFVVSFGHGNAGSKRPPNGAKYKNLIHQVRISGTGKWDGVHNTRPSWFFVDGNGRLGNLVIEGIKAGNFTGPVRIEVLS